MFSLPPAFHRYASVSLGIVAAFDVSLLGVRCRTVAIFSCGSSCLRAAAAICCAARVNGGGVAQKKRERRGAWRRGLEERRRQRYLPALRTRACLPHSLPCHARCARAHLAARNLWTAAGEEERW